MSTQANMDTVYVLSSQIKKIGYDAALDEACANQKIDRTQPAIVVRQAVDQAELDFLLTQPKPDYSHPSKGIKIE